LLLFPGDRSTIASIRKLWSCCPPSVSVEMRQQLVKKAVYVAWEGYTCVTVTRWT
jgi:hypothetical protein